MSKEKRIALLGIVAVPVIGLVVYFGFFSGAKPEEAQQAPISIDMPDAEQDNYSRSRLQTNKELGSGSQAPSYWDALAEAEDEDEPDPLERKRYTYEDLPASIYSRQEISDIMSGKRTKEEVDNEHALMAAMAARTAAATPASERPMTQAQRDSAYFARMERTIQLASKYAQPAAAEPEPETPAPEEPEAPEERHIDLASSSPVAGSIDGEGIITSLMSDEPSDVVHYSGTIHSKPVKATFLKNETVNNGQRVIIRLMQDLVLSDGTTIPANTHITGICSFSSRLMIDVKMLHYNGRMFPTDISVYDNDGTEGIYCPTVQSGNKKKKQAKKVAGDVASGVRTVLGTLITGNPFMGTVTRTGLQAATSAINDDGTVSVNVTAGYEFYVFENVKDGKR